MNSTQSDIETSAVLDVADFAFTWDDAQLWGAKNPVAMFNLRKGILGHPKGSTVTRDTILAALARAEAVVPGKNYGTLRINEGDEEALVTVESPQW